ncbi:MAG: hypothetical protein R6X34_03495 [Chloroflexota bacterium]
MSFDWQTEDETGWDDPVPAFSGSDGQKPERKRRRWRWLVPLGLLVVALTAAGWTLNRRVESVTEQMKADVLASHELAAQAITQQDDEVLLSVLSGREEQWAAVMSEAVAQGVLTDRSGLGLLSLPQTEPLTPTIEIQSDLLEAEVTTVLSYAIEIGNGLTETVQLAQTAVYRLGSNRWLLAPPDSAYWGSVRQIEGQYVTLFYPERDKHIAQALLFSLDEKIGQLCAQIQDVDCPADYRVIVELSADPKTFSHLSLLPAIRNADRRHLILPTPTLVGLPVDQAGKNALLRGYGQLVTALALTDLWGYDCCDEASALYLAVLADYLRQLGLLPWSEALGTAVPTTVYDQLLAEGAPRLFDSLYMWGEKAGDSFWLPPKQAAVLLAFAKEELGLTGLDMAQNLSALNLNGQNFGQWLAATSYTSLSSRELENAWLGFIYGNSTLGQQDPPIPLPEQDIELLCHIGGEERIGFYRYRLADGETLLEQPLNREVSVMTALPDDSGLAVWEAGYTDELTSMFLWTAGMKTAVSWDAGSNAPDAVPMQADPSNQKLLLAPAEVGQVNYGLLDVGGCLDNACRLETLAGYPVWSPDMAHMILLSSANSRAHMAQTRGQLSLADGAGEWLDGIGAGSSPFWLDNERYGFVMDAGEGRRSVILSGKIGQTGLETLLTTADLAPDGGDDHLRLFDFVAAHPAQPNQLVLVTLDAENNETTIDWFRGTQPEATLFIYDLEAEQVVLTQQFAVDVSFSRSYRFSPNGRFLLLGEGAEYRQTVVHVVDTQTGASSAVPLQIKFLDSIHWYTDFSLDGDWLLVMDAGFAHLLVPGFNYERLVIPTTGPCETAVWVNSS